MPAVTDPRHETFPQDDRLYRVFWAGETLRPAQGDSTWRIRAWLEDIDDNQDLDGPAPRFIQITESVGSIPRIAIGSFWRNGRKASSGSRPIRYETLEIIAPSSWQIVRAGDSLTRASVGDNGSHLWINPSDMRLLFTTASGRLVRGLDAPLVFARTTEGRLVVFPCYEIFRSCFAGTSDLAHGLTGNTWDKIEANFIVRKSSDHRPDGSWDWHLDLASGVPHSSVPYLAWMSFSKSAAAAANGIYARLVNRQDGAWIGACPPIVGQPFRIVASVQLLSSSGALLVNQIRSLEFPIPVSSLSYTIAERYIPVPGPDEEETSPPKERTTRKKPDRVGPPKNRPDRRRFFQLPSLAVKFLGLPVPTHSARKERTIPIPGTVTSGGEPVPRTVSVGPPGPQKGMSAAQYTPEEENRIEDRFAAIYTLIDELIGSGHIEEVREYPLVRPAPPGAPHYCEFPARGLWTVIRRPVFRPRLALVLEIKVEQRLIYWIETETIGKESYRSLAIETRDSSPLDEGTLETLLDLCALHEGRWPEKLPFGKGQIFSTRPTHKNDDGVLYPSVMLLHFQRLYIARHRAAESLAESATLALPPE